MSAPRSTVRGMPSSRGAQTTPAGTSHEPAPLQDRSARARRQPGSWARRDRSQAARSPPAPARPKAGRTPTGEKGLSVSRRRAAGSSMPLRPAFVGLSAPTWQRQTTIAPSRRRTGRGPPSGDLPARPRRRGQRRAPWPLSSRTTRSKSRCRPGGAACRPDPWSLLWSRFVRPKNSGGPWRTSQRASIPPPRQ